MDSALLPPPAPELLACDNLGPHSTLTPSAWTGDLYSVCSWGPATLDVSQATQGAVPPTAECSSQMFHAVGKLLRPSRTHPGVLTVCAGLILCKAPGGELLARAEELLVRVHLLIKEGEPGPGPGPGRGLGCRRATLSALLGLLGAGETDKTQGGDFSQELRRPAQPTQAPRLRGGLQDTEKPRAVAGLRRAWTGQPREINKAVLRGPAGSPQQTGLNLG